MDYTGLQLVYGIGPRAAPTVDGNQVYVLGAMGKMLALRAGTGEILWQKDFVRDYGASVPVWGMPGAPLVDGERVIALAAGEPDAKVMAFHRDTGEEIWRSLSSDWEPGYTQPVIFEFAGKRQLIIWHPRAISSLDPATGEVYWEEPFVVSMGMTVSTPILKGPYLFVSSFYDGARMLKLDEESPGATLLWRSSGQSETRTDKIHTLINTAVIQGDYLYGIDSYGQMRCLELTTRKTRLGELGSHQRKTKVGGGVFRSPGRSLLHQQRPRRADPSQVIATGLSRVESDGADRAHLAHGAETGAGSRSLVTPRLRQPPYFRPKRQGDPEGFPRKRRMRLTPVVFQVPSLWKGSRSGTLRSHALLPDATAVRNHHHVELMFPSGFLETPRCISNLDRG